MTTLSSPNLADGSVLITGATGGIGEATVTRAITDGAFVIACGRDANKLEQLSSQFEGHIHTLCYDVTDEKAISNAFREGQKGVSAKKWPALYGLVNGAGVMSETVLAMTSADA